MIFVSTFGACVCFFNRYNSCVHCCSSCSVVVFVFVWARRAHSSFIECGAIGKYHQVNLPSFLFSYIFLRAYVRVSMSSCAYCDPIPLLCKCMCLWCSVMCLFGVVLIVELRVHIKRVLTECCDLNALFRDFSPHTKAYSILMKISAIKLNWGRKKRSNRFGVFVLCSYCDVSRVYFTISSICVCIAVPAHNRFV